MKYEDESNTYTAVRWSDNTCGFETTVVSVKRHSIYPNTLIVRDLNNPNKQPLYAYEDSFKLDSPGLRRWVYIKDMTVEEAKEKIIECKENQVKKYYNDYVRHKNMLDIMKKSNSNQKED